MTRPGVHPSSERLSADYESILRDVDSGIRPFMRLMLAGDFETFESCQGGKGHAYPEPTIRFHGGPSEGFRALAWLRTYGVSPCDLRRFWYVQDGEPHGPHWEITFNIGGAP